MDLKGKIAIVIPALNEESFIELCLESVRQQSYPFEKMDVMVVDGGSTDRTCEIVKEYSLRHPNVRLLHNPQKIQSVAFNIGYAQSSAPILIRLDAHAIYKKKYIELCIKHLEEKKEVGDVGGIWDIQPLRRGLIPETNAIINKSRFGIGGAAYRVGAKAGYADTVPFGAFPRHVIEEIGGMREDMPRAEDNDYVTRIKAAGYKIYLDPEIECVYFSRDTIQSFLRQKYGDGKSIAHLFYINRKAIGIRHFVPFLFVCSLLLLTIGAFFFEFFSWMLFLSLGFYFCCDIVASLFNSAKYGVKYMCTLPWLYFFVHLSYGCGTIVGLINGIH